MLYKVKEVAEMVGISIRTLHHYDEIKLLAPQSVNPFGHRLYTDRELEQLQQILFFREIGLPLHEIKAIMDSPDYDRKRTLAKHKELLFQKKKRLEDIIATVTKSIHSMEGRYQMSAKEMFAGFDLKAVEANKNKYAALGKEHTLAVNVDGTVWGWGNVGRAKSEDGSKPTLIKLLSHVEGIAAAVHHSFAVKSDGTVWGWGKNTHGQLGTGTIDNYVDTPIQVEGIHDIAAVSAGVFHTLALKKDGTIWTWGPNWYGQLGDGTVDASVSPMRIEGISDVKEVAANCFHSMALKNDGTVWRWGAFGDCTDPYPIRDEVRTPTQIPSLDRIKHISAGGCHGTALREDGTVWTWGFNPEGQLGDRTFDAKCSIMPRMVIGLTDVQTVAAGGRFTLALRKDGTVWSWGSNNFGELGDGSYENNRSAKPIQGLTDIIHIAAGTKHAMALDKDGSVWLWGRNSQGQLGDIVEASHNVPFKSFAIHA
ncbi:MerR family transcriptional regulator [Paenibacillus sp. OV219]|uniref:MerR family transcriptional regulator n=1 Tax=Paenibacillus sp. OV219 TaxID=1884377 RepID=UPI0008C461F4|nr:MerR family transcriptional regulator [Paenibacillus sp. OV219]SEO82608.1 Alpha-tubulin suppressor [Paenibacillus sp. OV219]